MEGLCVSSLLGVLGSHSWLMGEEDVALLLERGPLPHRQRQRRAHSLSFSFRSLSADGGSEDLADPRSPGVDPQFSHFNQGKQSFKDTNTVSVSCSGICTHLRVSWTCGENEEEHASTCSSSSP